VRSFLQKIRPHASPEAYAYTETPPETNMGQKQDDDFSTNTSNLFKEDIKQNMNRTNEDNS
jgi:hypothetical protein